MRIPKRGPIDPEIRDLMARINALPGVRTTQSCAGFGRRGGTGGRHRRGESGYFCVAYPDGAKALWRPFHEALELMSGCTLSGIRPASGRWTGVCYYPLPTLLEASTLSGRPSPEALAQIDRANRLWWRRVALVVTRREKG